MGFQPHIRGDQADDSLDLRWRQMRRRLGAPFAQAVQPQQAVRIDHDFDDQRIGKGLGNLRPHGRAQHGPAALPAFLMFVHRAHSAAIR